MMVMLVSLCEHTETHWITYTSSKWIIWCVNYISIKLYPKKLTLYHFHLLDNRYDTLQWSGDNEFGDGLHYQSILDLQLNFGTNTMAPSEKFISLVRICNMQLRRTISLPDSTQKKAPLQRPLLSAEQNAGLYEGTRKEINSSPFNSSWIRKSCSKIWKHFARSSLQMMQSGNTQSTQVRARSVPRKSVCHASEQRL